MERYVASTDERIQTQTDGGGGLVRNLLVRATATSNAGCHTMPKCADTARFATLDLTRPTCGTPALLPIASCCAASHVYLLE